MVLQFKMEGMMVCTQLQKWKKRAKNMDPQGEKCKFPEWKQQVHEH